MGAAFFCRTSELMAGVRIIFLAARAVPREMT
jgi:hypothetical protein